MSDHYPITVVLKQGLKDKHRDMKMRYRSLKHFNQEEILAELSTIQWPKLDQHEDPEDSLDMWYTLFKQVTNRHAPFIEKRVNILTNHPGIP